MKITIAGYGAVGQAHEQLLGCFVDVEIYDPYKGHKSFSSDTDAVIICTATPSWENGACSVNSVYECIEKSPDVPILIKSTISLEGWETIIDAFPQKEITFSPEFLRNATSVDDLLNTKDVLLGGGNTEFWQKLFATTLGSGTSFMLADPRQLILIKYFRNSFLANKVAFFNQIYDLCKAVGIDYEAVAKGVGADTRIGASHTEVTGERGFGGHCFPKDIKAIIHSAQQENVDLSLLKETLEYNEKVRRNVTTEIVDAMKSICPEAWNENRD